jgi:hypothetical protein
MALVLVATFGSLSEASIAFASLASAGFHPTAGFNANTPGTADGMAPSAYPILAPEDEVEAARRFLKAVRQQPPEAADTETEDEEHGPPRGTLTGLKPVVKVLATAALITWVALTALALLRGCA